MGRKTGCELDDLGIWKGRECLKGGYIRRTLVKSCQAAKFELSNVPHSQGVCGGASFSSREEVFIRAALSDFATFQFSEILLVYGESACSSCGRTSVLLHLLCCCQRSCFIFNFSSYLNSSISSNSLLASSKPTSSIYDGI